MPESEPYLSLVVTARNDNHGGDLLHRMQIFTSGWIAQARRFNLPSELIVVEWNPVAGNPKLWEVLQWPEDCGPCEVRFIEVPADLHARYRHGTALPLYQMIAKNVGIRRARGKFVLATNIDILFNDELVEFLASQQLDPQRMYRIDRSDAMSDVPASAGIEDQLAYCATHLLRINAREGTFPVTPDGRRTLARQDIADAGSGFYFGRGWFPPERWTEIFRWLGQEAELGFTMPEIESPAIALEVEPGPGAGEAPVLLEIFDQGARLGSIEIRTRCELSIPTAAFASASALRLRVSGASIPCATDPRLLILRVLSCRWKKGGSIAKSRNREAVRDEKRSGPIPPAAPTEPDAAPTEPDVAPLEPDTAPTEPDVAPLEPDTAPTEPDIAPLEPDTAPTEPDVAPLGPQATSLDAAQAEAAQLEATRPEPELAPCEPKAPPETEILVIESEATLLQREALPEPGAPELRTTPLELTITVIPQSKMHKAGNAWHQVQALTRRFATEGPNVTITVPDRIRRMALSYIQWGGVTGWTRHLPSHVTRAMRFRKRAAGHADIFDSDSGVQAGSGWYPREAYRGEVFRWVNRAAGIILPPAVGKSATLQLQIEPGPGVLHRPFDLQIKSQSGEILGQKRISRLAFVEIPIARTPDRTEVVTLLTNQGGAEFPGDGRIMDFRVFWCGVRQQASPVLEPLPPPQLSDPARQDAGPLDIAPETPFQESTPHEPAQKAAASLEPPTIEADSQNPVPQEAISDACPEPLAKPALVSEENALPGTAAPAGPESKELTSPELEAALRPVSEPAAETSAPAPACVAAGAPASSDQPAPTPEIVLEPAPATPLPQDIHAPAFLHTNGCGDFTLLSQEKWFDLRAYPEFDLFSMNIDSVFCYAAHHGGATEELLPPPMRIYHIEHASGSGWTPEGETQLFERIRAKGLSFVSNTEVVAWAAQMRRLGCPIIFNLDSWGMAQDSLVETRPCESNHQRAQAAREPI